ncbi:MAG: DUF3782 domain-containing protein [Euryarchaeota archaeon]|nr:DUF3782 domain-containing protein [Euryarchaeota archaeon]
MAAESELKRKILDMLEADREFRVSVGALIGFKEILEKLEEHDRKFNEILERLDRHEARFEEYDRKFDAIFVRLEEHDRKFVAILERLDRHEARFEVYDRKFNEILERLDRHEDRLDGLSSELKALRMDFNEGMRAFQLRLDALGARWGIFAEEAFREGVKGIVESYFGGEVQKWVYEDKEGFVFGHPASVEVDLVIRDKEKEHVVVEVKSSISRGDVTTLLRKGKLYEHVKGVKPSLAIVSPFVEDNAMEDAEALGISVFSRLSL